jgi:hypothetical protein
MTHYKLKSLLLFNEKYFQNTKTPFKISRFYYNTHYLLQNYNNTVYCQPCQHSTDTLVHRFVPIIKNEDFTIVVMAIISFLPSSTTSKLSSGHNSL